jgi:hypothetical protein
MFDEVLISPHLDDGTKTMHWRNMLWFDPLEKDRWVSFWGCGCLFGVVWGVGVGLRACDVVSGNPPENDRWVDSWVRNSLVRPTMKFLSVGGTMPAPHPALLPLCPRTPALFLHISSSLSHTRSRPSTPTTRNGYTYWDIMLNPILKAVNEVYTKPGKTFIFGPEGEMGGTIFYAPASYQKVRKIHGGKLTAGRFVFAQQSPPNAN